MDVLPPAPKDWLKSPPAQPSLIVIPLQLRLSDLSEEFQRRFPDIITQQNNLQVPGCPTTDCRASFKVIRKGALQLRANPDGSLNVILPVRMEGQIGFSQSLGFTSVSKSQAFAGELTVNVSNRIGVNPDWSLRSQTAAQASFSQAVLPVELPMVGTLNLNIQPLLEPVVRKLMERQLPEIDKIIAQRFSIRNFVEPVWQKIREPQALPIPGTQAWLNLAPSELYFQNLRAEGDKLTAAVGLKGVIGIDLGEKPSTPKPSPLPNLKIGQNMGSQIQLNLPLRLTYTDLSQLINSQMAGKDIEAGDRKVHINKIDLMGNGDQLVIKVDFKSLSSPKADGIAYVVATPKFNPTTQTLEVENVQLSAETNSLLLKSAAWLANNVFESKIKELAKFDLGPKLKEIRENASTMLNDYRLPQAAGLISLQGQISDLRVSTILPEAKGLHVVVSIQGQLAAKSSSIIK